MTLSNLNRDSSLISQTVSSVSADGLTRTVTADIDGNGVTDLTQTDQTVIAGGARTETVASRNSDGSLRNETVTVTSADGLNVTVSIDSAGTGVFNRITQTAIVDILLAAPRSPRPIPPIMAPSWIRR